MGYPLMDLFLLILSGVFSRGTNLVVKQQPQVLEVAPGGKVNMTCNVTWTEVEQFRVKWKKDGKELRQSTPLSWKSSQVTWGSREKLVWIPENTIILSLDDVNANDSGHHVCHVTIEIPEFKKANSNGTHLIVSGLLLWLLVASVMVGSGTVMGKMIWQFLRRSRDSGNHFYGNVLSYHRKANAIIPSKDKTLACAPERKIEGSIYSTTFPKPPPQRVQSPRTLPDPSQPAYC
ncbi:transmembrane and immunoglobulin domain-containing protein 2 isoform X2 [Notamacropus eugenii]|uniref:transmembrane and immunoglobulin domain-containing protein 2 isoform X2 n=1 Tax=Notamacropus eugenii TaxID=9315 RepID=UPI003B67B7BB